MRIGVMALQGGFAPHLNALTRLGHEAIEIRTAGALEEAEGLVLPGGESTAQLGLLERSGLLVSLEAWLDRGGPVLATCAGLIVLASRVRSPSPGGRTFGPSSGPAPPKNCSPAAQAPSQPSLGRLDVEVERNAWGRQMHSFEAASDRHGLPLVFIRAPRITRVGPAAEVLDTLDGEPILVRQDAIVAATFHPELTADLEVGRMVFGEAVLAQRAQA